MYDVTDLTPEALYHKHTGDLAIGFKVDGEKLFGMTFDLSTAKAIRESLDTVINFMEN